MFPADKKKIDLNKYPNLLNYGYLNANKVPAMVPPAFIPETVNSTATRMRPANNFQPDTAGNRIAAEKNADLRTIIQDGKINEMNPNWHENGAMLPGLEDYTLETLSPMKFSMLGDLIDLARIGSNATKKVGGLLGKSFMASRADLEYLPWGKGYFGLGRIPGEITNDIYNYYNRIPGNNPVHGRNSFKEILTDLNESKSFNLSNFDYEYMKQAYKKKLNDILEAKKKHYPEMKDVSIYDMDIENVENIIASALDKGIYGFYELPEMTIGGSGMQPAGEIFIKGPNKKNVASTAHHEFSHAMDLILKDEYDVGNFELPDEMLADYVDNFAPNRDKDYGNYYGRPTEIRARIVQLRNLKDKYNLPIYQFPNSVLNDHKFTKSGSFPFGGYPEALDKPDFELWEEVMKNNPNADKATNFATKHVFDGLLIGGMSSEEIYNALKKNGMYGLIPFAINNYSSEK